MRKLNGTWTPSPAASGGARAAGLGGTARNRGRSTSARLPTAPGFGMKPRGGLYGGRDRNTKSPEDDQSSIIDTREYQ